MPTLTAPEIAYVRMMSGDNCGPDYDVSDEMMQYLYDEKVSGEPLCMSGDSLGGLIVWVLRARVRKATKLFNESNELGTTSYSQKYQHLKEQLESAEAECGMGGTTFSLSTLDLGLDTECAEVQGLSTFPYPYSWWGLLP